MIIDTDVLIWYSKKHQKAIDLIHCLDTFFISVVTYVEIIQGVRNKNKKELNAFKKALGILNAKIFQIDELVSTKAMFLVEQYSLSHSMELADALRELPRNNLRILLALLPVFTCCDNRLIVRLCTCYHALKTNKSSA